MRCVVAALNIEKIELFSLYFVDIKHVKYPHWMDFIVSYTKLEYQT